MGNIKVVVLDFDGVIVDSLLSIYEAVMKTFTHYGIEHISMTEMCSSIRNPLSKWFLSFGIDDTEEGVIEKHRHLSKEVYEKHSKKIKLINGAENTIRQMSKRNIPLYILSSAKDDHVQELIKYHGIGKFFKHIFSQAMEKDFFLEQIINIHKVTPREVLFADDWHPGIIHGVKAGCTTVGFARFGYTKREVLLEAGAHHVVSGHKDLLKLIHKLN